jgi:hypothetical protein
MKFNEHTSIIKKNKINDLNLKFKYLTLKYKLKDKLMTSDVTKVNDTRSFLLFYCMQLKPSHRLIEIIMDPDFLQIYTTSKTQDKALENNKYRERVSLFKRKKKKKILLEPNL